MRWTKSFWLLSIFSVLLMSQLAPQGLRAQGNNIVLTVAVPEWTAEGFEDVISLFEAENPGVDVVLVDPGGDLWYSMAADDIEQHLQGAADYARVADVVYTRSDILSVEETRAGYFIDLNPLLNSDSSFSTQAFVPGTLESFQWNGGTWAIPVSANVALLVYNADAFDAAGLAYPTEGWTIVDFANAARALAQTNAEGEIVEPGFVDWGPRDVLFRSLLGQGLYDNSMLPETVALDNPALVEILTTWSQLQREGIIGMNFSGSSDEVPMRIDHTWALSRQALIDPNARLMGSLLPGGVASLTVDGLAISGGTAYPELAFELARHLASNATSAAGFFGDTPAVQSLLADGVQIVREYSPENEQVVAQALANALPGSERRYMTYVYEALNLMSPESEGGSLDAQSALLQTQFQANDNLQLADTRNGTSVISVTMPVATPALGTGEVVLRFGVTSIMMPQAEHDLWEQALQEFADADPQVGQVNFEATYLTPEGYNEEGFDCYYHYSNQVSGLDPQSVRNLNPLLDADLSFDQNDVLPGVMQLLQRDNMIWAYPLTIQPQILWYNADLFTEAGLPEPSLGWTVSEFSSALQALQSMASDTAPFAPQQPGNAYLLMLIAAYGGVPIDYRTNPVTVNYTDVATMEAIRQVLDLAKAGSIEYQALSNFNGTFLESSQQYAIIDELLSLPSERFRNLMNSNPDVLSDGVDSYRLTLFPQGSQYAALSTDIGAAYITASTPNPEACYRLITDLSQRPALFTGLPARRTQFSNWVGVMSETKNLESLYNQIDLLLQNPNTIVLPTTFGTSGNEGANAFVPIWLNRAFDAYVLEGSDLETELVEAELMSAAYLACAAAIPPYDTSAGMNSEEPSSQYQQYLECAVSVDPSLASVFGVDSATE